MKSYVWGLMGLACILNACMKEGDKCAPNNSVAPSAEVQEVQAYINSNSITATKHSSGLFYSIASEGQGSSPNVCSTIKVAFSGKLTSGAQVEGAPDVHTSLKFLVPGWQIGMPLIKTGGRIKLYVPPSLGYGSAGKKDSIGNIIVPPNSILIYDVTLKMVE